MRTTGLWRQWGKKRVGRIERAALKYVQHHVWNIQPVGRCCSAPRVFSLVLYDDLERWGGKVAQEGVDIYIFMADSCRTAETNTLCKEISLQLSFLFSLKKAGNFDICNNMDGPWTQDAKWNSITSTVWFHLNEILRAFSIRDRRMVVFKSCGEGGCGVIV